VYRNNEKYPGLSVSPGIAAGRVLLHRSDAVLHIPRVRIEHHQIDGEMQHFRDARQAVEQELFSLRQTVSDRFGANYAEFIDTQLAILNDVEIEKQTRSYIEEHLIHVPFAYRIIVNQYIDLMDEGQSDFFKERILDIRDVKQQVLKKLLKMDFDISLSSLKEKSILVSKYLGPADIIRLSSEMIVGLVAETGGKTSHAAILAKAMGIPTLLGVEDVTYNLNSGDHVLIDAYHGFLIYQPDQETEQHYHSELNRYRQLSDDYRRTRQEECRTRDGRRIELSANIGLPVEADQVLKYNASGVGLYRSEYLYIMKNSLPTEEELYSEYRRLVEKLPDQPIVLRTIDLGGDKVAASLSRHFHEEANPFMGYRAIRISLDRPELFTTQIKAMLRAAALGNVSIMLPMISVIEELRYAAELIGEAKDTLRREGKAFAENVPLGILIEVPSAAMMAEELAAEADFFSIGTNDLTQYLLAVDRGNEKVNALYNYFDPVVIRTIRWIVNAANSHSIPVSVCGEMAADPKAIMVLLGLGIHHLSMSPVSLDRARSIVRRVDFSRCRKMSGKLLKMNSRSDIKDLILKEFTELFPDLDPDEE